MGWGGKLVIYAGDLMLFHESASISSLVSTDGRSHVVWMTAAATVSSWKGSLVSRDIIGADDLLFVTREKQLVGLQNVP